jgi:hypothetical protein
VGLSFSSRVWVSEGYIRADFTRCHLYVGLVCLPYFLKVHLAPTWVLVLMIYIIKEVTSLSMYGRVKF